jgi:hypothetical protein
MGGLTKSNRISKHGANWTFRKGDLTHSVILITSPRENFEGIKSEQFVNMLRFISSPLLNIHSIN